MEAHFKKENQKKERKFCLSNIVGLILSYFLLFQFSSFPIKEEDKKFYKNPKQITAESAYVSFLSLPSLKDFKKIKYWKNFYGNNPSYYKALKRLEKRIEKYKEVDFVLEKNLKEKVKGVLERERIRLEDLLNAIEIVESYGNSDCISNAGAIGPYQLMIQYHGISEKEAKDPLIARKYCWKELQKYIEMFTETETPFELALAAYNWGPGNVKKIIKKTGIKNWWELLKDKKIKKKIPRETRNYVPKVLAVIELMQTQLFCKNELLPYLLEFYNTKKDKIPTYTINL